MALIACPECHKQISDKVPTCPHCGCPLGAAPPPRSRPVAEPAPTPSGGGFGRIFGCLTILAVAAALAFTNPSETDMRTKIAQDGWVPVGFERTNLIVLNWVSVNGATGAKAKYVGVAGGIFKLN